MPFIKFSQFTTTTNPASIDFLVGYEGTTMKKIDPANIGGGATDLNGLTDCLVDTLSLYVGEVPSGLSGNPQSNTTLGLNAGDGLTTVVIGKNASPGNNAGMVIIGDSAGGGSGNGSSVIIGSSAGLGGSASSSVIIGKDAGRLKGGSSSIKIGQNAGGSTSVFTMNNILIGFNSGRSISSNGHMSIGHEAGYSNTSGASNTNIGYQAGYAVTTGGTNTFVGYSTGKNACYNWWY